MQWLRKCLPCTDTFHGQDFFARVAGRRVATPLFLALVTVEAMDLIFALDSVPAIFGVTRDAFIVFTSNVFAIIGLRSLYGALAGAMRLFRFLKSGLAAVLVFIGVKMLIDPHEHPPKWFQCDIPDFPALLFVTGIIGVSILISVIAAKRSPSAAGSP